MIFNFTDKRALQKATTIALFFAMLAFGFWNIARATVSITQATGGTNISADLAANSTSSAFTTLGNIVIASAAQNDFTKNQANVTLIMSAPTGWRFNPGVGSGSATGTGITFNSISITSTTVTVTYTRANINSNNAQLTISGLQIQAQNGANVPGSGNITRTGGTGTINGCVVGAVLGALSQTGGAKVKLAFTTQPPAQATATVAFVPAPVVTVQDRFGNTKTSDSTSTISLSAVQSSSTCAGTPGSGTLTTIPASPATVSSGVVTFSTTTYSIAEDIRICAQSPGLASALSNTISVKNIPTATTLQASATSTTYGTSVTFTATVTPAQSGPPTGTVTFKDGATTLGTTSLNGANPGVATYSTSSLSVSGSVHAITAHYNGAGAYEASTSSAVSVTVSAKNLTATGITAADKEYDGTPVATLSTTSAALVGVVGGDDVTLNTTGVSGQFSTSTPGTGILVTISGLTLSGGASSNYSLTQPTTTASITFPVPVLTSLSPTSTIAGGSGFTLTLTGSKFTPWSEVRWNGSARATTYVSSTQLTASILAGDIAAAGTSSVTVFNPTPGGGTSGAQVFTVLSGASKIVIIASSTATVGSSVPVTVEVQDGAGELVSTYNGSVTLVVSSPGTGGGSITITNGIGTSTVSATSASTVHLSLSDTGSTGLNVSSTADMNFVSGSTGAYYLSHPGTAVAGTRTQYTITRKDAYGNLVTSGADTAYLYSSSTSANKNFYNAASGGSVIQSVTFATGSSTATFWYYDDLVSTFTITASDNGSAPDGAAGIADAADSLTILPSSVSQFTVNHIASLTAGERAAYTITRKDAYGNLVVSSASTVYLYSTSAGSNKAFYNAPSGGSAVSSTVISDGQSSESIWYYDDLAGSPTVAFSDNATDPDGSDGIDDATDNIVVVAAGLGKFALSHPGTFTAGTRVAYTLYRQDVFGNAVSTGTAIAYLYSSSSGAKAFYNVPSGGSPVSSVSFSSGSTTASFWYYDDAEGTWTLTASDNASSPDGATGIVDATDSITVTSVPIIATRFIVMPVSTVAVGNISAVTIEAQDDFGRRDSTYNGGVTLSASGSATGGGLVTITNGIGSANITDTVAESVTLSLVDSQSTGLNVSSSRTQVFTPGPVSYFTLTAPADIQAGSRAAYTVSRKDQYGNSVTTGSQTIYLYDSPSGGSHLFTDAASGGSVISSVSIGSGASSAQFWFEGHKAGTWNVIASDNASSSDGAVGIDDAIDVISVSAGPTSQLVYTAETSGISAGSRAPFTVARYDAYLNSVTSGSETYYLFANPASGSFYTSASGGSPVSSVTFASGLSAKDFWYADTAAGARTLYVSDSASAPNGNTGVDDAVTSITVSALPVVATRYVILPIADTRVGSTASVVVQAQDDSGNLDTTVNGVVGISASGSATGAGVIVITNGVGAGAISDSVEETVVVSLYDAGAPHLNVSSTATAAFSTTPSVALQTQGVYAAVPSVARLSTVIFSGRAFPGAVVAMEGIGDAGGAVRLREKTVASPSGAFTLRFSGVLPGLKSFFANVTDENFNSSQSSVFTLQAFPGSTVAREALFFPPTINAADQVVFQGDAARFEGYAVPSATIFAEVDGNPIIYEGNADRSGKYVLSLPTANISLGVHVIRVKQRSATGPESEYSGTREFAVSSTRPPMADLNGDGKMTIADWSIFWARWFSKDQSARKLIDLNGDGVVDIKDFSIFAKDIKASQ